MTVTVIIVTVVVAVVVVSFLCLRVCVCVLVRVFRCFQTIYTLCLSLSLALVMDVWSPKPDYIFNVLFSFVMLGQWSSAVT